MANREPDRAVRQTVLDRLIDDEPRVSTEGLLHFGQSVTMVKTSLLRDLEWLLNTRRIAEPASDAYPEVQRSVYHFGLPDTTSLSAEDHAVRKRLQREIEECLELFEPRLDNVEVTSVQNDETRRTVHFSVQAVLRMGEDSERIAFDTVLDVSNGTFRVGGSNA